MRQENFSPESLRFSKDPHCSYRFIQTLHCFTEVHEKGIPQQKCQRIYKKFRECPGRPVEVFENVEDNVDPKSVMKSRSSDLQEGFKNQVESDFGSIFSSLDEVFTTPWTRQEHQRRGQSIRQKLGDYFSYEKEKERFKKVFGNEWKQFEKDCTEI
eukprot:g105.t1